MKLMHVDGSPRRKRSNSRALGNYFVDCLRREQIELEIDYLDVTIDTPAHTTELFAAATYAAPQDRTEEMKLCLKPSDLLCQRLLNADAVLFALPMYNFSVPSAFKAFIDNIIRTGITYKISPEGAYIGQLSRQKVLFVTSRGADLRPGGPFEENDALTPALRAAFGFIGVTSPIFVDAQPMQFADPEARAAAYGRAEGELAGVARQWAASGSASKPDSVA